IAPPPFSTLFPYTTLFRSRSLLQPLNHSIFQRINFLQSSGVMFFRRYSLALGLIVISLFKLRLVQADDIYGSATEYDALWFVNRSEEHTSELQSRFDLVCR